MHLTILETTAEAFFKQSQELENSDPGGKWRYFKFISAHQVLGIFESETPLETSVKAEKRFFKYFLGTFSPGVKSEIEIHQLQNFKEFCLKLNSLLTDDISIYDLSVNKKWIWSQGSKIKLSKKLLSFIDFK